jgi:long-chain acyl-CoA synthetase
LVLALVYTSGTTGRPKGVALSHANVLANVHFLNYWMPYKEGGVFLHAAPMFHIADFPLLFAAPAFGTCQVTIPKFSAQSFCEAVERDRVTHTVLVPTMINMLAQFPDVTRYDLATLERIAYGGSPTPSAPSAAGCGPTRFCHRPAMTRLSKKLPEPVRELLLTTLAPAA